MTGEDASSGVAIADVEVGVEPAWRSILSKAIALELEAQLGKLRAF